MFRRHSVPGGIAFRGNSVRIPAINNLRLGFGRVAGGGGWRSVCFAARPSQLPLIGLKTYPENLHQLVEIFNGLLRGRRFLEESDDPMNILNTWESGKQTRTNSIYPQTRRRPCLSTATPFDHCVPDRSFDGGTYSGMSSVQRYRGSCTYELLLHNNSVHHISGNDSFANMEPLRQIKRVGKPLERGEALDLACTGESTNKAAP